MQSSSPQFYALDDFSNQQYGLISLPQDQETTHFSNSFVSSHILQKQSFTSFLTTSTINHQDNNIESFEPTLKQIKDNINSSSSSLSSNLISFRKFATQPAADHSIGDGRQPVVSHVAEPMDETSMLYEDHSNQAYSNLNSYGMINSLDIENNVLYSSKLFGDTAGTKRSRTTPISLDRAPSSHPQDHVIAERKRRERLTERFIALSAMVPNLKKVIN